MSLESLRPALISLGLPGDMLMAVPAIRAIGATFGYDIPVVCGSDPEHQSVFANFGFKSILGVDIFARPLRPGETLAIPAEWTFDVGLVVQHLQALSCDGLINVTDSCGPEFRQLTEQLKAPSAGFHDSATLVVSIPDDAMHAVDRYFCVARQVTSVTDVDDLAVFPHRPDREQIRQMVRESVGSARVVAMHADTKPEKMWPLQNWAQWLQLLWREEPDTRVLLLGYPAIDISRYAVDPRLLDCRDLPLTVNYELAGMADQFVGIDSCMLHAADLCRVPGVGIFTEQYRPESFGFRFADGEHLVGSYPPDNITVEQFHEKYRSVRDRAGVCRNAASAQMVPLIRRYLAE